MTHTKPYIDRTKHINYDITLCETTNYRAGKLTATALTEASVSFSKHWIAIPWLLRSRYKWSPEVCVIKVNRNEYCKARRVLSDLEPYVAKRLKVNIA